MSSALRAECSKYRTIRTTISVMLAMLATIALAVVVHIIGFKVSFIDERAEQLGIVLDIGVGVGVGVGVA